MMERPAEVTENVPVKQNDQFFLQHECLYAASKPFARCTFIYFFGA